MATETETTQRQTTAARTADEDLIARAPAHDGVATQRDLRETERYLLAEIRASRLGGKSDKTAVRFGKTDSALGRMDANPDAKLNKLTWLIIIALIVLAVELIAIYALLIAVLLKL